MPKQTVASQYHNKKEFVKIESLFHLRRLAQDPDPVKAALYTKLAMVAASNLGMPCDNLEQAMRSLNDTANETDERGTVEEINFVRDCVKK